MILLTIDEHSVRSVESFIFMEFPSVDAAAFAINAMHGHPFDAKHTFALNKFSDVEKFAKMDETYHEPEIEEHKPKVREHCIRRL